MASARSSARERNAENNAKLESEYATLGTSSVAVPSAVEAPSTSKQADAAARSKNDADSSSSGDSSSSDDEVGPPVPSGGPGSAQQSDTTRGKKGKQGSDDESSDDEEETLDKKIPKSHECRYVKTVSDSFDNSITTILFLTKFDKQSFQNDTILTGCSTVIERYRPWLSTPAGPVLSLGASTTKSSSGTLLGWTPLSEASVRSVPARAT